MAVQRNNRFFMHPKRDGGKVKFTIQANIEGKQYEMVGFKSDTGDYYEGPVKIVEPEKSIDDDLNQVDPDF